ncbi:glycosyltransferase [Paenibacillus barcinonensis]|uniref:Glycosyl transferase family 1 n=1 Tax=Paenibacillus barcinonensis TaxID=198119 RepID=A0A2V4W0J6_PAEBA|nr:glycosyltransferase [Paenibacillus barcinonensis]PYE51645.1 glycosyl transferase family 1 [Paenibacillus barcinonensis]QKS56007.1 glycosyltransferase [Paenibacillus barcinonensis]
MGLKVLFTNNSSLIKYGIASGFKNLGHEVHIMDGKYQLWDKDKETQVELIKKYIENNHVDIVFSECFANFAEGIFEHTKEKGIFHAFWAIEDTPFDHWIGDYWSDYADYIFTTTAECLPNYWNKGKQAELMLFGCNPDFHKRVDSGIQRDIVLIANNYERRFEQTRKFIMPVVERGYDVSIFGNEWWMDEDREANLLSHPSTYKGYGAYEDLPYLYSTSKIILGQNLDDKSITQTSMRPAESLGIGGGILISPFTPAQQYLFHDHVYLPRNTDEMLLMVDEVLGMTDIQREQKAKKAQEFVYKYHNYNLRAEQVINAYHGYKP